jgi:hypothetical protein
VIQLVDCHVHYYQHFGTRRFLDCAAENLSLYADRLAPVDERIGILLLAEPSAGKPLEFLTSQPVDGWVIRRTGDPDSMIAESASGVLVLIAGRQIITRERLEILALGTGERIEKNLSLDDTVDRILSVGALAVAPWGFGKWWLRRGDVLRRFIESSPADGFFLGDNGGRAGGAGEPEQLRMARAAGIGILPGSDPLPLSDQVERVGSYGLVLSDESDLTAPTGSLVEKLRQRPPEWTTFGTRTPLMTSLSMQLHMQFRKRLKVMP